MARESHTDFALLVLGRVLAHDGRPPTLEVRSSTEEDGQREQREEDEPKDVCAQINQ